MPPHVSRARGDRSAPGCVSKMCCTSNKRSAHAPGGQTLTGSGGRSVWTDPLVEVVAPKLHCRVGHDSDAICTVSPHETPPTLFSPHLLQRLPNAQLVLIAARALDLEQDLQALQGGNNRPRHGAGHATCAEGCDKGLRNNMPSLVEPRWRGWG